MTTQTWINIMYIIGLSALLISLINSHKFGMKYYRRVINVLATLHKLTMSGKIDLESSNELLNAISSDKDIGDSVDVKKNK